jgi:hypothetical protein
VNGALVTIEETPNGWAVQSSGLDGKVTKVETSGKSISVLIEPADEVPSGLSVDFGPPEPKA